MIPRHSFLAAVLAASLAGFTPSAGSASEPTAAPLRLAEVLARSYEIGPLERPAKTPARSLSAVIQDILMPEYLSAAGIAPGGYPAAVRAVPVSLPRAGVGPRAGRPPAASGPTLADAVADRHWRKHTSEKLRLLWR